MASRRNDAPESGRILGSNERLIRRLHPDPLAFFRYYGIGLLLLIWSIFVTWLFLWGYAEDFEGWDWPSQLQLMAPALVWFAFAFVIGVTLARRLNTGLQVLYWIAVIVLPVVTGLFIWLWDEPTFAPRFSLIWAYVDALLTIGVAELYRRAFSYYITDLRIVIRYKLFSSKEVNLRFEKIEDWKVTRPFIWRILGVGTIRPYTGTEDGKTDPDRAFDAPDECLYGIRHPIATKKLLVDLVLERDQIMSGVAPAPVEVPRGKRGRAKERARPQAEPEVEPEAPEPEEVPAAAYVPVEDEEEAPSEKVVYYTPAPQPAPQRNYERVEVPEWQRDEEDEEMPPPAPDEEEADETAPRPVRTMYPQAREPALEPRLVDQRAMDFERPSPGTHKKKRKPAPDDDFDQEVYDEGRPRSL